MNKRPSIYIGASLEALIKKLKGRGDKTSSIINDIADKYTILVEQCRPALTRDEWLSLCAAYNGHMFREGSEGMLSELRTMEWQASEWIKYAPGEAGQFDTSKLVEKVEALTLAERISVLFHVRVFWATGDFEMFDK